MHRDWKELMRKNDLEMKTMLPQLENNRDNRVFAAKKSFKWFMYLYMSHYLSIKPAPFQILSYESAKILRLLEIWPRGFGKSVIWSVGYPLWKLLCNPDDLDLKWEKAEVFLISKTSTLSEKWLLIQKRELLNNARIVADFEPHEGAIWRNDEYELQGRGRVRAIGVGGQFRGEHPRDSVLDDIEDREEAKSEASRVKLREWFYGDFLGAMRMEENKEAGVKIIGNLVNPLGLMNELYKLDWWETRKYSILHENGEPLWPEYMDEDKVALLRKRTPESIFMAEYMNKPVVSENPVFRREQFQSYEPGMLRDDAGMKISHRDMYKFTALDPAISQRQGADFSAITTWGLTMSPKPRIFCLEARRGHWSAPRQITELMANYEKFPGTTQIIETVSGFKAIYQEYKERLDREGMNVKVIDVNPSKDKGIRANSILHLFDQKLIHFDMEDKMQGLLMDELVLFDYATKKHGSDDFVDSTVYAMMYIDILIRRLSNRKKRKSQKPHILWTPDSPIYGDVHVK